MLTRLTAQPWRNATFCYLSTNICYHKVSICVTASVLTITSGYRIFYSFIFWSLLLSLPHGQLKIIFQRYFAINDSEDNVRGAHAPSLISTGQNSLNKSVQYLKTLLRAIPQSVSVATHLFLIRAFAILFILNSRSCRWK